MACFMSDSKFSFPHLNLERDTEFPVKSKIDSFTRKRPTAGVSSLVRRLTQRVCSIARTNKPQNKTGFQSFNLVQH